MPNSSQLRSSVSTCTRLSSSRMRAATGVPSVGTLWSAVASVRSGRRTLRPARRRPSNAGGDDGQDGRLAGSGVLEVVGKVGVEGDAIAAGELVALAVDVEHDGAALDERDLAAARLVHRRVAGAAGLPAGRERVAAELGALGRQRSSEELEAMACPSGAAAAALAAAHD